MNVYGVLTVLLGGGIITAALAVLKFKPERDSIIVSSAANATQILRGLNENLRMEVDRLKVVNLELTGDKVHLEKQLDMLEARIEDLHVIIGELREKLKGTAHGPDYG